MDNDLLLGLTAAIVLGLARIDWSKSHLMADAVKIWKLRREYRNMPKVSDEELQAQMRQLDESMAKLRTGVQEYRQRVKTLDDGLNKMREAREDRTKILDTNR